MHPAAPPGWYPDPSALSQLRWFDGVQWSPYVSTAPAAPSSGPDSAEHWLVPVGRSGQAILAGYLGLFAIVIVFLGPLAIGAGVWGLRVAERTGTYGRGRCWFGIAAGVWGTTLTAYLIATS